MRTHEHSRQSEDFRRIEKAIRYIEAKQGEASDIRYSWQKRRNIGECIPRCREICHGLECRTVSERHLLASFGGRGLCRYEEVDIAEVVGNGQQYPEFLTLHNCIRFNVGIASGELQICIQFCPQLVTSILKDVVAHVDKAGP